MDEQRIIDVAKSYLVSFVRGLIKSKVPGHVFDLSDLSDAAKYFRSLTMPQTVKSIRELYKLAKTVQNKQKYRDETFSTFNDDDYPRLKDLGLKAVATMQLELRSRKSNRGLNRDTMDYARNRGIFKTR